MKRNCFSYVLIIKKFIQELYSLGVALQNLEGQVLRQLENAMPGNVKKNIPTMKAEL